jgi:hypothetical protein
MERHRLFLTVYFADARRVEEVLLALQRGFGSRFRVLESDDFRDESQWVSHSFGVSLVLSEAGRWPEGPIYRLSGMSIADAPPGSDVSMDGTVAAFLELQGIAPVFSNEDFQAERRRRAESSASP